MSAYTRFLPDEAATEGFGRALARALGERVVVIYLHGPLGAGKTTLVRGMLRGWGWAGRVKSPTYGLVEPYQWAQRHVYHFDLYRLHDPSELEYIGIRDMTGEGVLLIEWPDRGGNRVPSPDLECGLEYVKNGRIVTVDVHTVAGEQVTRGLELQLPVADTLA